MKLTLVDLQFLMEEGRRIYLNMDAGVKLHGSATTLTEAERRIVAIFAAGATIYRRHGLIAPEAIDGAALELETGDSETATFGFEAFDL
jgi:hypothetical protein